MGARVDVRVRRAYDPPAPDDGVRVLVDRVWPRGLSRERAALDLWCREIAPSTELRRWYGHDPQRFAEFRGRYLAELAEPARRAAWEELRVLAAGERPLTLLTATRDPAISQAAVLAERLRGDA
jgi:uncharacterized protein YeaO (DUF488 family)